MEAYKTHFESHKKEGYLCSSYSGGSTYRIEDVTCKNCIKKYNKLFSNFKKSKAYRERLKEDIKQLKIESKELEKRYSDKLGELKIRTDELMVL